MDFGNNKSTYGVIALVAGAITVQAGILIFLYKRYTRLAEQYSQMLVQHADLRMDVTLVKKRMKSLEEGLSKGPEPQKPTTSSNNQPIVNHNHTNDNNVRPAYVPVPISAEKPQVFRVDSMTSDSDYADAIDEEDANGQEWTTPLLSPSSYASAVKSGNNVEAVPGSNIADNSSNQFQVIDDHHEKGEGQQAYDSLKKIYNSDPAQQDNVEVLWRLARATHQISTQLQAKEPRKKDLLLEGQKYAEKAVKLKNQHFLATKWAAVVTGALSSLLPTKEKIEQGYVFKDYLDKGLAMDPAEYSLLHMRGRFAFSVASLSWLEKSVASTLFVAPPKATFQEALADFLEVERIRPNKWIDNLLYLAKAYIAVSDKTNAAKYLKQASELEPADDSDKEALAEVKTLMKKYK